MTDDDTAWEQQAMIYLNALETALTKLTELEGEIDGLDHSLRYFQREMPLLRTEHELALAQRDQVIIRQQKEITHLTHILQIQQRLLRIRQKDTK